MKKQYGRHAVYNIMYYSHQKQNMPYSTQYSPYNIRQMRDVINYSIDASSPLIEDIGEKKEITTVVELKHIPFDVSEYTPTKVSVTQTTQKTDTITEEIATHIRQAYQKGYGAKKNSTPFGKNGILYSLLQSCVFSQKRMYKQKLIVFLSISV